MRMLKKVFFLLTANQRKKALWFFVLMIIGMTVEMLGLGLIIPVIGLLMNQRYIDRLRGIEFIARHVDLSNPMLVICYAMLVLVIAYALKTIYLLFLSWREAVFAGDIQVSLSQRLMEVYMRQPYAFHLRRNSSDLMRNVIGQVNQFASAIKHLLLAAAEGLVFTGVCLLLLAVEPKGTIITVAVMGAVGWGLIKMTKVRLMLWGETRQRHDGLRNLYLQEGITGIKDIKVFGKESYFLEKHQLHNAISAHAEERQSALQQSPRLLLELLAVLGLLLLVASMLTQGKNLDTIVPTLGLFAAAAFRLIPSASRIVSALHVLRYSVPFIDTVYREMQFKSSIEVPSNAGPVPLREGVNIDHVVFGYEEAAHKALNTVSIEIQRGQMVGVIGQSGSGKSTLVDIVLGLLYPESGRLMVDGRDVAGNLRGWQSSIGYVPQTIFLTDDTLRRNIAFGVPDSEIDEGHLNAAIKAAQLDAYVSTLPEGLETVVGERGVRLSGGQRQRIGIARALYRDPDLLVLDEATSALDTETETEIMQAINAMRGSKTILVVAHRLSTVEQCNKIYRFDQGRVIASGTPDQVLRYSTT